MNDTNCLCNRLTKSARCTRAIKIGVKTFASLIKLTAQRRLGHRVWLAALLAGSSLGWGQSITVNPTDYRQTIDMMGGDMERSSGAIQAAANKESIIQWGFGDIAFNTCRVQYDKKQELTEGVKNWAFYDKQVTSMQEIKAVNPDIQFFATLRSDYDGYGNENNLPDWICDYATKTVDTQKYGIFLADYVEYMNQQGVPIAIMSVAKEWASFVPADVAAAVISTLQSELSSRGVPMPLICDQGFWSLGAGINYVNDVTNLGTQDLYWGFCSHDYAGQGLPKWIELEADASAIGKPLYHDESGSGGNGATSGAEIGIGNPIARYVGRCDMYSAGLKGEIFFEIWSRGLNNETRPIYFPSGGTGTRMRAYFIMKKFANGVVDSTYVTSSIDSMPDVHTMAFRKGDQVVLWVINQGLNTHVDVPISLNGSTLRGSMNASTWTANTSITGDDSAHFVHGGQFTATIAAESLNCYSFKVGPGLNPLSDSESFEVGLGAWVQSVNDDYDWTLNSGGTPTAAAGPDGASDGSYYLYAEGHHGLGSYKTAAIEAASDFSAVRTAELRFDYHMHGAYIDYLALDVFDGTSWTTDVWIRQGQQHGNSSAPWSSAAVDLSSYAGKSDVTLRFRTANTAWNAADPAIDNIVLEGTGGPIIAGYDFSEGTAEATKALAPYVSASVLASPMDIAVSSTIGDNSGVDATGLDFGKTNTPGCVVIGVDDATGASLADAVAGDDYLTFTVTPDAQVTMNLEAITFKASKTASTSVDEYAVTDESGNLIGSPVVISTLGQKTAYQGVVVDLSGSQFQGLSEPVTFRIYAWGRGTTSVWGTAAMVDKVTLHGSITFNATPSAIAQSVETTKDTPVDITLTGSDVEGASLVYNVASQPSNGALSGAAPDLTYTPNPGYVGLDSFTFTVNDGQTTSAAATVTVLPGPATDLIAGYDFDDGNGGASSLATASDGNVNASPFGVGAGLIDRIDTGANALAEAYDASGHRFGTANPLSYGGARSNFGFTDMNNADNLALAIANDDYMTFTITPDGSHAMDLTSFTFRTRVNSVNNSAERWALFSSVDGFAEGAQIAIGQTTVEATYVNNVISLPAAGFQGLTAAVEFRLYIYGGNEPWSAATMFDKVVVHGSTVSTSPLVAHWSLDDGSGTTVADVGGNGFDATLANATWVTGVNGSALNFNGTSSTVTLPATAFATVNDQVSISMWVHGGAGQPQNNSAFYAVDASNNRVLNVHLPWSNGSVYWDAGFSGGYDRIYKGAAVNEYKGQWNHWVFTKNAVTGDMAIYLNGNLWHSGTGKTRMMSGINAAALGSQISGVHYDGLIDDVQLYDVSLTATEVSDLFTGYTVTNNVPAHWLMSYGIEPTDAGALADTDGDGLANWEEYAQGKNPTVNDSSPDIRVTEYYLTTGDFTGTTTTITLGQDLANDYYILVRGSRTGDGSSNPNNDYARVISVPGGRGDLADSGANNLIGLQRQAADFDWEGVVTVVECQNSASAGGFKLVDAVVTAMSTTSGTDTSAAWTDINQVVLFGGYRGGGVEMFGNPANRKEGTGCYTRLYPSGSGAINWSRDAGGETMHDATMTTFVVEWGSEWTIQHVNVAGNNGGGGADATGEYTTAAINSVVRANTWVWGTGTRIDSGIGDSAEACLVTLGDGVNQNANETLVAVGSEYTDAYDFDVYVMTHSGLQVDHRFKLDGDSTGLDVGVPVNSAPAGARFGWVYNGCHGTGTAFPRPRLWSRYTSDTTVTVSRGYDGQPFPAWVQGIDLSGLNQ